MKKERNIKERVSKMINESKRLDLKPKGHKGKWVTPAFIVEKSSPDLLKISQIHETQRHNIKTNSKTKHNNLYQLLSSIELLTLAHNSIYKNKGALTKGTTEQTVEGVSDDIIHTLSLLIQTKNFQWTDTKRVYIERENKKPRPLGISSYTDKLVQFVITLILNAIYDPIFEVHNHNYGFRPHHSTHDNIFNIINYKNQGLQMAIEGDISGAFDNINHKKLIGILKREICDEDFLNIIEKACKNKIVGFDKLEFIKETITPELGTPQGFIMSPILFNIYMNDFDQHITEYIKTELTELNSNRNTPLKLNDQYKLFDNKIRKLRKQKIKIMETNLIQKLSHLETTNLKRIKSLISFYKKIRLKSPSRNLLHNTLRWFYTRYADDFIIITNADITICEKIKTECSKYLHEKLSLTLNDKKTAITDLKEKPAKFLGFALYMSKINPKITQTNNERMGKITRRGGSTVIKVGIDLDKRINQLIEKKYAKLKNNKPFPTHATYLTPFSVTEIVEHFNQVMDGICNYYFRVLTNPSQLNFILYILYYSCIFTIAHKTKSSTSKIHKKYSWMEYDNKIQPTGNIKLVFTEKTEFSEQNKYTALQTYKDCLAKALQIAYNMESKITDPHLLINEKYWKMTKVNWRTSTQLPKMCLICGSTENTEAHHTNALRKSVRKRDKKKEPLYKFLSSINRKQIPLCHEHHQAVHLGKYNDLSLKNIYDERLTRISNYLITQKSSYSALQDEKNKKFEFIDKFKYKYHPQQKIIINPYSKNKRPKYTHNPTVNSTDRPTTIVEYITKYFNDLNSTKPKTQPL